MSKAMLSLSAMGFNEAEPDMVEFNIAALLDRCRDQFICQAVIKRPEALPPSLHTPSVGGLHFIVLPFGLFDIKYHSPY